MGITRRGVVALALAALASLSIVACVDGEDADVGTVDVNLTGQAPSGAVYRLRDATITVAGPSSTLVWHTEDDPNRTALSANVAVGNYTAALAPGWRLERLVTGQPAVNVTATLVSPNPVAFTVAPMMRTAVPLRFTVEGGVVDMSQGYDITIEVQEIVTSIITMPSTLALLEGTTATIGVRLASAPMGPVTVAVTSSDPTAVIVAPSVLTFTPANFNIPQQLNVMAVQDADSANEAVTLTLASPGLPFATVAVTVMDDDSQAIVTSVSALSITEGGSGTIGVRLASQPAANVTVTVVSSDATAVAASPVTLTFTPASFNTFQTVAVTGVQDADVINESVSLVLSSVGVPSTTVAIQVADDDAQAIITSATSLTINEGGTGIFTVRLAAQPAANVVVNVTSSDPGAAATAPNALVFTPANFSNPQVVTVAGVQDADTTNEAVTIALNSAGVSPAIVAVTVTDDD